jgi:hypothetical protein
MNKELFSFHEAMQFLGLKSYKTFSNNFIKGGLPVVDVNGSKRIKKSSLLKFLDEHEKAKA